MPTLLNLKTVAEERGNLTIIERGIPFPIKRVFFTYHVPVGTVRGRHSHKKNRTALVALAGSCEVSGLDALGNRWDFRLSDPATCLVLDPGDWHQMRFMEDGTVLLCLASEDFDPADYVYEPPNGRETESR